MKYYVVADVHGFYSELYQALSEKGYFNDNVPHKLILCGDLFDRGKEAVKLQRFLGDLYARGELILIRGNHEDLMEDLVERAGYWLTDAVAYSHHWSNGTVDTLLQLTGLSLYEASLFPARTRNIMLQTPFFRTFLPVMRDYFETEHYIFTHGWLPCTTYGEWDRQYFLREDWRTADREAWNRARWYNGIDAAACGAVTDKTVVCGHFHTSYGHAVYEGEGTEFGDDADFSPYRAKGILAIDGCTAYSKKVNCIVLQD